VSAPASLDAPLADANVAGMLWQAADRAPDHPAIVERDARTSYAALRARAAATAAALVTAGVRPGDRVAVFLERGPAAAAAFYGAAAAGAIVVNVNETLRPRQVEHILDHCAAAVLLTTADILQRQPRAIESAARTIDVGMLPHEDTFAPVPRVGNDYAQIIYTSGSTGLPKGVTLTHANIWAGMRSVSLYVGITAADRIASLLPFSFDYGFNQLLCAVGNAATLVVERSPMAQQIAATLREQAVTVLPCVPPLWLQLLAAPAFRDAPLPALRAMTNTGGRVPTEAVRQLRRSHRAAQLYLMYGLTEAFRATYLPPELCDAHPDSIGRAIPGCQIMVLDEAGNEVAPDGIGELVQRGPTVAAGYWNDPETTARVYRPNPQRPAGAPSDERVVYSGDLVRRDADGLLYYEGRRDRMIKTLGFRVSPDEIVDVLHASGMVVEALVGTEDDAARGTSIVAYVVLADGATAENVHRFCRAEMPRYMQPARIEARAELPRTTSGKFDLRAAQGTVEAT
jgi:amino acid adenylation domain-containing protein